LNPRESAYLYNTPPNASRAKLARNGRHDSTAGSSALLSAPAGQIIVATARMYGLTLITGDERSLSCPHVRTIWGGSPR